ncbi:Hypothetical protein SMAX5B_002265 [Scophthalmus maximus]|uniref:Uncharacterized protein n=1 Tax=Scophthalmus maximus TaxID=52904 RepID=A0A2U9BGG9_SCOMX|nr:Hypothetical protein SMAX5B_002265 [Scophthalmus maximus]
MVFTQEDFEPPRTVGEREHNRGARGRDKQSNVGVRACPDTTARTPLSPSLHSSLHPRAAAAETLTPRHAGTEEASTRDHEGRLPPEEHARKGRLGAEKSGCSCFRVASEDP